MVEMLDLAVGIIILALVVSIGAAVLETHQETILTINSTATSDSHLGDNASTLTLAHTPSGIVTTTSKNRTWLEFDDGATDIVNGSWQQVHQYNLSHSFSLWFNSSTNFSDKKILLYSSALEGIEANEGNLSYYIKGQTKYVFLNASTSNLNDSDWHHVVVTFNATDNVGIDDLNATLWIDGVAEVVMGVGNVSVLTDANLSIGNSTDSWEGWVDEFRWYNVTLTNAEVAEIYNSGRIQNSTIRNSDLVVWLPMNENTGTSMHTFNSTLDSQTLLESRTGPAWTNDGVDNTLTNGTDYTVSGTTFTIFNIDSAWNTLSLSYSYTSDVVDAIDYALAGDALTGLGEYGSWFKIIVIVGIAGFILVLIFISFGRKEGEVGISY